MSVTNLDDFRGRVPTSEDIDSAADAMMAIENNRAADGSLMIGEAILSAPLVNLLSDMFNIVARGDVVTVAPLSLKLTTQEAADLLNVSRPFLIKLINRGDLGCEKVGTHRRLRLTEVLEYKEKRSEARQVAMDEMQEIAENLAET